MPYHVLGVCSNENLIELLRKNLPQAGYVYREAASGSAGMTALSERRPDLLIIDLGLPDIDGLVWLRMIRQTKEGGKLPAIVASPRHTDEGMAQAFELGADDYICYQEFDPRELLARLRAVVRRRFDIDEELSSEMRFETLALDPARRRCMLRDKRLRLRPREFELLEILMRKSGRVLSRRYLLESVWGMSGEADTRAVDVTISRLRKALGSRAGRWIETVEHFGYCFRK